jgi:uncharacterized protein (TIGR00299 family) protein
VLCKGWQRPNGNDGGHTSKALAFDRQNALLLYPTLEPSSNISSDKKHHMFSVAYVDCPTGISGDMCLGALVDAGVPLTYIEQQLQKLNIADEYRLSAETVQRNGQAATKVHVRVVQEEAETDRPCGGSVGDRHAHAEQLHHGHNELPEPPDYPHHHHPSHEDHPSHSAKHEQGLHPHGNRHLPEITALIQSAHFPQRVEQWSLAIFQTLAKAEGLVHGMSPDLVHFHEVGATDAIVDIVGTCLGFDYLGITHLYWSALPTGGGTVRAAHGKLPVPAPAVLRLFELRQVPIYHNGIHRELVTPTGAAIATTLATQFGPPPAMQLQKVGLGAGSRDLPLPNVLRLWLGTESQAMRSPHSSAPHHHAPSGHSSETPNPEPLTKTLPKTQPAPPAPLTQPPPKEAHGSAQHDVIIALETQLDDLSPQAIGYVFDALFQAGALDVLTQAVGMKKNRPGILLTVICKPDEVERCESVLFKETTTLGIRRTEQHRTILHRELHPVDTPYGTVRVKVARRSPTTPVLNVHPEYDDCAELARKQGLPWLTIHRAAIQAWQHEQMTPS